MKVYQIADRISTEDSLMFDVNCVFNNTKNIDELRLNPFGNDDYVRLSLTNIIVTNKEIDDDDDTKETVRSFIETTLRHYLNYNDEQFMVRMSIELYSILLTRYGTVVTTF